MRHRNWLILAMLLSGSLVSACTSPLEQASGDDARNGALVLTEEEVVVRCMKSHGFDIDMSILEDPGVIPRSMSADEAEAYSEVLLGRRNAPAPDLARLDQLVNEVGSGDFDVNYNCVDIARWYRQHTESPPPSFETTFEPIDPDADLVLSRLAVEFQLCLVDQGVEAPFKTPDDLVLELQYLEFLQGEAKAAEATSSQQSDLIPIQEPLTAEQVAELGALRAADNACSGDYYGAFAKRWNELVGAPKE